MRQTLKSKVACNNGPAAGDPAFSDLSKARSAPSLAVIDEDRLQALDKLMLRGGFDRDSSVDLTNEEIELTYNLSGPLGVAKVTQIKFDLHPLGSGIAIESSLEEDEEISELKGYIAKQVENAEIDRADPDDDSLEFSFTLGRDIKSLTNQVNSLLNAVRTFV